MRYRMVCRTIKGGLQRSACGNVRVFVECKVCHEEIPSGLAQCTMMKYSPYDASICKKCANRHAEDGGKCMLPIIGEYRSGSDSRFYNFEIFGNWRAWFRNNPETGFKWQLHVTPKNVFMYRKIGENLELKTYRMMNLTEKDIEKFPGEVIHERP